MVLGRGDRAPTVDPPESFVITCVGSYNIGVCKRSAGGVLAGGRVFSWLAGIGLYKRQKKLVFAQRLNDWKHAAEESRFSHVRNPK